MNSCMETPQSLSVHRAQTSVEPWRSFLTDGSSGLDILGWRVLNFGSVFRERSRSAGFRSLEMTKRHSSNFLKRVCAHEDESVENWSALTVTTGKTGPRWSYLRMNLHLSITYYSLCFLPGVMWLHVSLGQLDLAVSDGGPASCHGLLMRICNLWNWAV